MKQAFLTKKELNEKSIFKIPVLILFFLITISFTQVFAQTVFSPDDVMKIKSCGNAQISPDGEWIVYTVSVPRCKCDKPGSSFSELYLISTKTKEVRPFITGKVSVRSPRWSPDGSKIAFLTSRGEKAKTQVWEISVKGGESSQITKSKTGVSSFRWHPSGKKIIYLTTTPNTKKEDKLKKRGYGFIYYQEKFKHRNLYIFDIDSKKEEQLTKNVTVWDFEVSSDGKSIAATVSEKNFIDYRYMFRKIHLVDIESKSLTKLTNDTLKLGNYAFSPDGSKIVYARALERKDHQVSQVFVMDKDGDNQKNLTIPDFRGHVHWVGWKDNETIVYRSGEGAWNTLSLVNASGGEREVILDSKKTGIIFRNPSFTKDFRHFAMTGGSPNIPGDVFYWSTGGKLKRLTSVNPWLAERKLGKQEIVKYNARDGLEVEGILIYPLDYKKSDKYPLVVLVHGGPESHRSNNWLTRYSEPGQALAGKGYAVFYPNYRASTGYGVKFALEGYEDAAGKEFDDIADGIDHLIKIGLVDKDRVGLGGGSYGGFASAWFASYYTKYVKAVCMFVGISDLISKRGTTDIPYEELYVHSGKNLDDMWDFALKRSPIYWAHQSKTATLIYGGAADTRVHPSQSLEFYWRLKMNDHPAVRLVQYPGEGHGNRKQPGRIDVMHRQLQWYDWYVKDKKPLDGPLPPLDISDSYGLDLDK